MKIENGEFKHIFEIDEDLRYIIMVSYPDNISPDKEELKFLVEAIDEWWKSDQKFLLVYERDGMKIKFERLENE